MKYCTRAQVWSQPGAYAGGTSDMVLIVPPRVSRVSCRRTVVPWTGGGGSRRGTCGDDEGAALEPGAVDVDTSEGRANVGEYGPPRALEADKASVEDRPTEVEGAWENGVRPCPESTSGATCELGPTISLLT
jgi:hypothetical protein